MKLALLVSGNLGLTLLSKLEREKNVIAVFTDRNSSDIIAFSKHKEIPCFVGNPRAGRARAFCSNKEVDVLVSINYLFLIEKDLIEWPAVTAFNVHGSLLPKYRGRTPHVWAIINNEKETGITAHLIDEDCDTGNILKQIRIEIPAQATGGEILEVFSSWYPVLVDQVLENIALGNLTSIPQDDSKATYFGKRTPDDGQINWDWAKERIVNWVRAQANPYPGAFTFYGEQKVIIDEVEIDDFGFHQNMKNGEIIGVNPLRVKTPNGCLRIKSFRNLEIDFLKGKQFA